MEQVQRFRKREEVCGYKIADSIRWNSIPVLPREIDSESLEGLQGEEAGDGAGQEAVRAGEAVGGAAVEAGRGEGERSDDREKTARAIKVILG